MDDTWSELESMADLALKADSEAHDGDSHDHYYEMLLGSQHHGHSTNSSSALTSKATTTTNRPKINTHTKKTYYLIKLDGPLSNPETIRVAGALSVLPEIFTSSNLDEDDEDEDEDEDDNESSDSGLANNEEPTQHHHNHQKKKNKQQTLFVRVDNTTKDNILTWLSSHPNTNSAAHVSTWRPTIIKDSAAPKDLSSTTANPSLGLDTTLPQNRLTEKEIRDGIHRLLRPAQNEYPVWYFFYGTLSNPNILRRLFNLVPDYPITYRPAWLVCPEGGDVHVTTWGNGKYNALVDFTNPTCSSSTMTTTSGDENGRKKIETPTYIEGLGFLVRNREQEDALRYYETDQYEVVRCFMELDTDWGDIIYVSGLTFRFTGVVDGNL